MIKCLQYKDTSTLLWLHQCPFQLWKYRWMDIYPRGGGSGCGGEGGERRANQNTRKTSNSRSEIGISCYNSPCPVRTRTLLTSWLDQNAPTLIYSSMRNDSWWLPRREQRFRWTEKVLFCPSVKSTIHAATKVTFFYDWVKLFCNPGRAPYNKKKKKKEEAKSDSKFSRLHVCSHTWRQTDRQRYVTIQCFKVYNVIFFQTFACIVVRFE